MQASGDVRFIADVWYLPGPADSTRADRDLALQQRTAVRAHRRRPWQAAYGVTASVEPETGGGTPIEKTWEQSVNVGSFDETMLTGETIVFQTDLTLAPGKYGSPVGSRPQLG